MELIHNNTDKVVTVNLSLFEGNWVECTEVIKVGSAGTFSLIIKKVSDGTVLLSYNNNNIMTIRPDNNFIRPKWGIYRSLLSAADLRDESVRFAGFSIQEGTTSVSEKSDIIPKIFHLEQNYPNPFNGETSISYRLSAFSLITLKIYDLIGREIIEAVNEYQKPGKYSFHFLTNNYQLTSGIYYYQLRAGSNTSTKKMILLK